MRIVSLHPAATEIAFALGLADELVAVTSACTYPTEARLLPVVAFAGAEVMRLDLDVFRAAAPDLVITAGTTGRDVIGQRDAAAAVERLGLQAEVLRLDPATVEGVLNAIQAVGAMTEAEDEAMEVAVDLRERLHALERIVMGRRDHGFQPPRVVVLEGLETPVAVGRWVPEQVRLAGGWELLGREGEPPMPVTWETIREMEPELLVIAPRGWDLGATQAAWDRFTRPEGWAEIPAVQRGRVFALDGPACLEQPGPRVIDGIEALAELVDPAAFDGMSPPDTWLRLT